MENTITNESTAATIPARAAWDAADDLQKWDIIGKAINAAADYIAQQTKSTPAAVIGADRDDMRGATCIGILEALASDPAEPLHVIAQRAAAAALMDNMRARANDAARLARANDAAALEAVIDREGDENTRLQMWRPVMPEHYTLSRDQIRRVLAEIPEKARARSARVMELVMWRGYTGKEAARIMKINKNTVTADLERIRAAAAIITAEDAADADLERQIESDRNTLENMEKRGFFRDVK